MRAIVVSTPGAVVRGIRGDTLVDMAALTGPHTNFWSRPPPAGFFSAGWVQGLVGVGLGRGGGCEWAHQKGGTAGCGAAFRWSFLGVGVRLW